MEIAKRRVHILFHRHVKPIIRRMSSSSASSPDIDLALPRGSLVLVTGASGFIAGHIVQEALDLGFRVRGTVRTAEKADIVNDCFPSPNFEAVVVPDLKNADALDDVVRDCVGVIHTACVASLSPDPTQVIPSTVAMTTALLTAVKKAGTCKRFVFTSSSSEVAMPKPDTKYEMDKHIWNDQTAEKLRAMQPPCQPEGFADVYAASKIEAERAVWRFVKKERPDFVVNTIIPSTNIGKVLFRPPSSSARFVSAILNGDIERVESKPPQWMINVTDDARIHLGAMMDKTVSNERVSAFATSFHWDDMLGAVQRARPRMNLPDEVDPRGSDVSEVDNALARELLRKWFNQAQFTSLEDSVEQNLEGYGEQGEKS
jgi:nucleoside-diphosphate-sugar epimerase